MPTTPLAPGVQYDAPVFLLPPVHHLMPSPLPLAPAAARSGPGTASALLDHLAAWRHALASALCTANATVDEPTLKASAQRILDRVLFLRVLQAKAGDASSRWLPDPALPDPQAVLVARGPDIHRSLGGHLFAFHAADSLSVPPDAFRALLTATHPEQCPFRLDTIDPHLLGRAYEASLRETLRRDGTGLTIERSSGRRRAGGVYYTPAPIVALLCDRVLGPLLHGLNPAQAIQLRILDPTCGAGAFLVGAYRYLLDWHIGWYRQHRADVLTPGSAHRPDVVVGDDDVLQLSMAARSRILQRCIHGIDIDPGAVDAAWLALSLTLLEGFEAPASAVPPLPDLRANIACADALTDSDRCFDAPFDAVLGNPPYVKEYSNRAPFEVLRRSPHAHLYRGKMDLWYAFTNVSIDRLRDGGRHGFVVQNNWPQARGAAPFRAMLRERARLESIVDFHDRMVFADAGIQTMVYVLRKQRPSAGYTVALSRLDHDDGSPLHQIVPALDGFTHHSAWVDPTAGDAVMPLVGRDTVRVLQQMQSRAGFQILRSEVGQGIIGGPDAAFLHSSLDGMNPDERALLHPHHTTAERFSPSRSTQFIAYLTPETLPTLDPDRLPRIAAQLVQHRDKLQQRRETRAGKRVWYHLHWPRRRVLFEEGPKLVCPTRVFRPRFAVVHTPYYCSRAVNVVVTDRIDLHYLCGVLSSMPVHFWLQHRGKRLGSMLQIDTAFLVGIPVPDPTTAPSLAQEIQRLSQRLHAAKTAGEERAHGAGTDDEAALDACVGELFGLSVEVQETMVKALR